MTASELEARIVEAEKDPALIRALIRDFKEHKDNQLSDLTTQVNAANAAVSAAQARATADVAEAQAKVTELTDAIATNDAAKIADALLTKKQKRLAEIDAQAAKLAEEKATLEASAAVAKPIK